MIGGRLVGRFAGTESEALEIYDKFFSAEYCVVMAIGWSEGRCLSDGSIMHAYILEEHGKKLCYRVRAVYSEKQLTYKRA